MRLIYAISVGWRYTTAAKKSGLLSFLSGISMVGLVLGISLLITVLSVMNGFERELKERILGLVPQATIQYVNGVDDWRALVNRVGQYEGVVGSAPFIEVHSLLSYRQNTTPALIYGIDVDAEVDISLLDEYVQTDVLHKLKNEKHAIVIGSAIASKLDVKKGVEMLVVAPSGSSVRNTKMRYFRVAGVIHTGSELDQSLVLANLKGLAELRAKSDSGVDGLRLKFEDLDDAAYIASVIANDLGPGFYQQNWQREHGNLYHAIQMSKKMVGFLMSLVVALAAFNVVSTLILVVIEKRASIAILRTLGASSGFILMVFFTQGCVIGIGGILLGIVFGCLLTALLEPFVQFIETVFDTQFLHSDVYPLTDIPTEMMLVDIANVSITAMILVFIATIYPAWRATRLQPADVLRYE